MRITLLGSRTFKKMHLICWVKELICCILRWRDRILFPFKQTWHGARQLASFSLFFYYSLSCPIVLLYSLCCCIIQSASVFPRVPSRTLCLIYFPSLLPPIVAQGPYSFSANELYAAAVHPADRVMEYLSPAWDV